jgi:hypothetical protein
MTVETKTASIPEERVRTGVIRVPSKRTNSIREVHIVIGPLLCGFVEGTLC